MIQLTAPLSATFDGLPIMIIALGWSPDGEASAWIIDDDGALRVENVEHGDLTVDWRFDSHKKEWMDVAPGPSEADPES